MNWGSRKLYDIIMVNGMKWRRGSWNLVEYYYCEESGIQKKCMCLVGAVKECKEEEHIREIQPGVNTCKRAF